MKVKSSGRKGVNFLNFGGMVTKEGGSVEGIKQCWKKRERLCDTGRVGEG